MLQVGEKPGIVKATGTLPGKGSYLLHWRVLSIDGHAAQGQVSFKVGP
jgi:methionine-rich copper-binding protein CopC